MTILWVIVLLVFLQCFTIYQWWFEQSRSKQLSEVRKSKIKPYKKPLAWAIYSGILFIIILVLIGAQVMELAEALLELNQ